MNCEMTDSVKLSVVSQADSLPEVMLKTRSEDSFLPGWIFLEKQGDWSFSELSQDG